MLQTSWNQVMPAMRKSQPAIQTVDTNCFRTVHLKPIFIVSQIPPQYETEHTTPAAKGLDAFHNNYKAENFEDWYWVDEHRDSLLSICLCRVYFIRSVINSEVWFSYWPLVSFVFHLTFRLYQQILLTSASLCCSTRTRSSPLIINVFKNRREHDCFSLLSYCVEKNSLLWKRKKNSLHRACEIVNYTTSMHKLALT